MTPDNWKRVEELFEAAQKLPGEQRAEFLRQACLDEEGLRVEVESLLKAADSGDGLLDGSPLSSLAEPAPAVKAGDKLGNFQIVAPIGRGGMGEVYRARDLRLKREVAIKTLPSGFAADRDRIARFEREARTASALNHPNIVSVFDIGTEGGVLFIVSELVDGETLARVIQRGPLPLRKLIEVGTQICDGLAAAHAAGVIHRDLKPGNIMLTRDGRVKILDFGLARQDRAPGIESTTMEARRQISGVGMIVGTPGYMSPEQVRGESTDARSDIFSLGVILYEMASGKRAFAGGSSVEVMNSILKDDPPELPPASPPALDRIVRRCIEKQPTRRFQGAADLGFAIRSLTEFPVTPLAPRTTRRAALIAWVAGVAAFLAIMLAAFLWFSRPLPQPQVSAMVQITDDGRGSGAPMLTDGTRLLFNLSRLEPRQLSVKGGEPVPFSLPMENVVLADISPDRNEFLLSRELLEEGPRTRFELWALPALGGSMRRLGNLLATEMGWLSSGTGHPTPWRSGKGNYNQSAIAWSRDGQQLVYPRENELHLARSDGTEVRKLTTLDGFPFFVRWSPDGRRLRVSVSKDGDTTATLWEVSVDDGHARRLFADWDPSWYTCCGNWTSDGKYYVFQSRANLWALREKKGFFERSDRQPVQLTHGPMAAYWPLPSVDGKRIFFQGYQARNEFLRYDLRTKQYSPELPGISGEHLEFSRDGKWVVYVSGAGEALRGPLFRAATDGSQRLQLTSPPLEASLPHWSPDGKQIAFAAGQSANGPAHIYVVDVDGSGLRQVTDGESGKQGETDPSWSPDGASLAFGGQQGDSPGQEFIRVVDMKTGHVSVLPGSQGMWSPRWSPDGRVIAGLSEERSPTGRLIVYDLGTQKQSRLFDQLCGWLSWSSDGESLFFGSDDGWACRVRMRDRKVERVANLQKMRVAGWGWFAAAPNDSFVTAVFAGTEEIYAIEWKEP